MYAMSISNIWKDYFISEFVTFEFYSEQVVLSFQCRIFAFCHGGKMYNLLSFFNNCSSF